MKDDQLELVLVQGHVDLAPVTSATLNGPGPVCRFVNVELVSSTVDQGVVGTVLLENPCGKYIITHRELVSQVDMFLIFVFVFAFCHVQSGLKKYGTLLLSISLPIIDRFSKYFHWHTL